MNTQGCEQAGPLLHWCFERDSEREGTLSQLHQRPERVKPYMDKPAPAFGTCQEQMEACTPERPHLGDTAVTGHDENLGLEWSDRICLRLIYRGRNGTLRPRC